jgi:hypothetical protein
VTEDNFAKRHWEPMRLEAVGSLGTVITSMTGSVADNNPTMPGLTYVGSGKELNP